MFGVYVMMLMRMAGVNLEKEEKEINKAISQGKVILGRDRNLKLMKQGKVKKVYLAKNTPDFIRQEVEVVAKSEGVNVINLDKTSNQIGVMVGKRFNVLVLGILK